MLVDAQCMNGVGPRDWKGTVIRSQAVSDVRGGCYALFQKSKLYQKDCWPEIHNLSISCIVLLLFLAFLCFFLFFLQSRLFFIVILVHSCLERDVSMVILCSMSR
jgi:hypothetical protein